MTNGSTLRINRAKEDDIPFILKAYKQLTGTAADETRDALTAESILADVLGSEPKAFISVMTADDEKIGFVYYTIADDGAGEQNASINALYIDSLSPRIGVSSVGRTVLNYLFVLHRGIKGVFAKAEHASQAMQSITSQFETDFRYNAYNPQSQKPATENTLLLKVRSATTEDIPFILTGNQVIDQKSYEDTPPNPLTAERLHRDVFNEDNPRAYILIADVDGQPSGFVMYSYCYFASEGEGIWLTNFYIDPFCRKGGIGKALLEHMKTLHPTTSGIYGAIASTNTIARHFFSGTGAIRYADYIIYGTENDWGVVS